MNRSRTRTSSRNRLLRSPLVLSLAAILVFLSTAAFAQVATPEPPPVNGFRIGERLTYGVSIGRFSGAAYAELYTVSRGRLGDKDAIELRSKFKTLELASAAFYMIDESRTTFVSPSTGLPLHTTITSNTQGLPKDTVHSFAAAPTPHTDLVSMIYKIRHMGGSGAVTMQENDKVYSVSFQTGAAEKHKTDAGEFETTLVTLQSEYFTEHGLTNVRINLSNDEARVPVLIRFRTTKGAFRAALASIQMIEAEAVAAQPTPTPVRPPVPDRTPKPAATPAPYVDNMPLAGELAFDLGERLEYRLTMGGQPVGKMRLLVKERKQFNGFDSLVLEATFSETRADLPFASGDHIRAYVDPETLAPRQVEFKLAGALRKYNGTVKYERQGSVVVSGGAPVDTPVGTHSILSLLYAARSFNLKPSRDLNNPINDTRVAVFWDTQPYIFTLRPSAPEVIIQDTKPVAAQLVTVTTKNPALDQLNIRIFLGNDDARIPLRFMVGPYEAELISVSKVQPN